MKKNKILIFRIGSIGDTIVSLPCFNAIRNKYINSEIACLTNFPTGSSAKEVSANTVLGGSGLVDKFFNYPPNIKNLLVLFKLYIQIFKYRPHTLFYLMPIRSKMQLIRDLLFFKICGVKKIIGLKFEAKYQTRLYLPDSDVWESESSRLIRLISEDVAINVGDSNLWRMHLSEEEFSMANITLSTLPPQSEFIVMCIGSKLWIKDWGTFRWNELIKKIATIFPEMNLVFVGSSDEHERVESFSLNWSAGKFINLCGKTSPRVCAAIIKQSLIYIGHDSGPMHLASSVEVPSVAIFSSSNKPGEWFPFGDFNKIIYNKVDCFGCGLNDCLVNNKKCINGISVDEVANSSIELIYSTRKRKNAIKIMKRAIVI